MKTFKNLSLTDKILIIVALVLFVTMLVLEFCPITQLARIIIGACVGGYFLGCLIFFAVRNIIRHK